MKTIITTAVAMTLLASSAMAYGEKHGYQPPVGGPGYGEGASQENDIHGDDYSPDHMDAGGDSIDGYEDDMFGEWSAAKERYFQKRCIAAVKNEIEGLDIFRGGGNGRKFVSVIDTGKLRSYTHDRGTLSYEVYGPETHYVTLKIRVKEPWGDIVTERHTCRMASNGYVQSIND